MTEHKDQVKDFAFECKSMIIIQKFKASTDWGALKQLFEEPPYICCGFKIFCANLVVGLLLNF